MNELAASAADRGGGLMRGLPLGGGYYLLAALRTLCGYGQPGGIDVPGALSAVLMLAATSATSLAARNP